MITKAIRSLLLSDAAISDYTGGHVWSDQMQQGADPPCIVLLMVNEDINNVFGGPLGVDAATFQVESVGRTRQEADDLATLVRKQVGGFRGTVDGVVIREGNLQRRYEATDEPEQGSDLHRYRSIIDVVFTYGTQERSC